MKQQAVSTGIVLDIDHFAVHDGPGIRTCVYLKGCPLRCQWCHSPESQVMEPQILFAQNRCTRCNACVKACPNGNQAFNQDGTRLFLREKCELCGHCLNVCFGKALVLSGKRMSADSILKELLPDRVFFQNSGGGVTLSGGEVLMQPKFTYEICKGLHQEGIHTIVETCGYGKEEDLLALVEVVDQFYYDFKLGTEEEFMIYVGDGWNQIRHNLIKLRQKTDQIILRVPLIPGITDTDKNVESAYDTARKQRIREVHLLPYNESAEAKYEWLERPYLLAGKSADWSRYVHLKKLAPKDLIVKLI